METSEGPASAEALFARVVRVVETGSTSSALRAAVAEEPDRWPHLSVLVAEHQTAGRGRAGRAWQTPPGVALTASVLLRPRVAPGQLGLGSLVAGLAVRRALARLTGLRLGLKWPNDVLVLDAGPDLDDWRGDRKVAGILVEALPDHGASAPGGATLPGAAVPALVVGIGVNVNQSAEQLPVPWATSLAVATAGRGALTPGGRLTPGGVLEAIGEELRPLVAGWERGDRAVVDAIREACVTLGRQVRVELPGGERLTGIAQRLEDDGRLTIATATGGRVPVLAGDVLHVR